MRNKRTKGLNSLFSLTSPSQTSVLVSERFYLRELRDPDLQLPSKRQVFTFPRQLAVYLARQLTSATLADIGRAFGGVHYSTVLHSIRRIDEVRRTDPNLNRAITGLLETLS